MATQERVKKEAPRPTVSEREAKEIRERDAEVQAAQEKEPSDLLDETEALLDEIDDLLEVNAEEFVAAYVQKGGQ